VSVGSEKQGLGAEEGGRRGAEARDVEKLEGEIAAEFVHELGACADLESFAVSSLDPWSGRAIQKSAIDDPPGADEIIALLFSRATKTYKAILVLARKGYGDQAAMLNRSLFEGMAVAHWVTANREVAAERFVRGWRFDRYLVARVIDETGWLEEGASAPRADISEAELKGMERDFGRYGQNLWTGHRSLRDLVGEIESQWGDKSQRQLLRNFLRVVNRDNNQLLHSTVSGLTEAASGMANHGLYLAVGPSKARIERALFAAYWTYAQTLGVLIDHFSVPVRPEFEEMLAQQEIEFRRLTAAEVRGVGRNDECPCESGRKFKHCHQGRPLAGASR
jgi:hypothetical protein